MKHFNILGILFLACMLFASCNDEEKTNIAPDSEHLNVDKEKVMRYVQCPQDTVDYLLQIADSIHSQRDKQCSLDLLGMDYEEYNHCLDSAHGDTLPLLVSLYASYDAVTTGVSDNISAAFVWHEVAKQQIAFYMGKEPTREDVETIFRVMEDVCEWYDCGWQLALNISSWRRVMLADYRLVDAYIGVMDKYEDEEIVGLVHKSYESVLDSYQDIVDNLEYSYSDLPRQLGVTMRTLMDTRRSEIESVQSTNIEEVKKILVPRKIDIGLQEE